MNSHVRSGSDALVNRLRRIDVFKHAIANKFKIDLRTASVTSRGPGGHAFAIRFHYLAEVESLLEPRIARLCSADRRAFREVTERAQEAFWSVYLDFNPLVHSVAAAGGVESESLEKTLARGILLFDVSRKTKFVTYLEKTLRESVKNLRGKRYAEELGLPLSAGRLVPQLMWELHQDAMRLGRALSSEESDRLLIGFLRQHRCRFSESRMQQIARALREERGRLSIEQCWESLEPSVRRDGGYYGNDCYVDEQDERQHQLAEIARAMERAGFDAAERALAFARLELPHDESLYDRIASKVTSATLRKRKTRLLVRLMAARYAPRAPHFGCYLNALPKESRGEIQSRLRRLGQSYRLPWKSLVDDLLNWMSLSDSVYRISILERGRLETYLCGTAELELPSPLFQKLKAALIEQDRLDFPCHRTNRESECDHD